MKSFKFNLFLIFLALVNLPFALYAQDVKLREYFPLEEGNIWVYEVKEGDEVSIEKIMIETKEDVDNVEKVKFISYEDGEIEGEGYIGRDSEGIKFYKVIDMNPYELYAYTPFDIILPFDVETTKKYEYSCSAWDNEGNQLTGAGGEVASEIKFEGEENVTVPAGEFLNCIKISKSSFWSHNDGRFKKVTSTIWFARNVGKVKEIEEGLVYKIEENTTEDIKSSVVELKEAIVNGIKY